MNWEQLLEEGAGRFALGLDSGRSALLVRYLENLDRWNRRINLTSLGGARRVERLVLEPLWVARQLGPVGRYVDVGSGNGSPAIPWCALQPFVSVRFVEARERRAVFLRQVCRNLALNVEVLWGRLQELPDLSEDADWVTLQGVRLDASLLREVRRRFPGARIVWLTRRGETPEPPLEALSPPFSDREALVFAAARTSPGSGGGEHSPSG